MPNYPFLNHTLDIYDQHLEAWKREERRLYGGDAVLTELLQWKGEETSFYNARQGQAGYITLPKIHAQTLTGHLSGQTPEPEWGNLGKRRERKALTGAQTPAELMWYNLDGVGQDGQEFMAYWDGVEERAIATGVRWILVEKPSLAWLNESRAARRLEPAGMVTGEDMQDGFRPFPVEYSPIDVPYYQFTNGRLDFAVINISITPDVLVDSNGQVSGDTSGKYLLVRRGFAGLGSVWAGGGWWKFDGDHNEMGAGTWDDTNGQIPLFQFKGEPSMGTTERPAIARSLTMELGQIAVSLMNRISERNWNIMQAAKSVNHVLGINKEEHGVVVAQQEEGSITVGYPPVMGSDGRVIIPTIWNSSAALIDSQAFATVIESGLAEAREIMVKQLTAAPDTSGRSTETKFAEATSPLLSRLAATRQSAINNWLHFGSLRMGIQSPTANIDIPREFDLESAIDKYDAMLSRLKRSWLRSETWERELLLRAGEESGTLPDDERDEIEKELEESATPTEPANPLEDDGEGAPGRQGPPAPGLAA